MIKDKEFYKTEYMDIITHNGKQYIREEVLMNNWWTIRWDNYPNEYVDLPLHYFNKKQGWGDDNKIMNISNPLPELEIIFQQTFRN